MTRPHFNGPDYDPKLDHNRLSNQLGRIKQLMLDGRWRSLNEIARATGDPVASISAQLRHLRKERFGSFLVDKRRRGEPRDGLFEYRLLPPDPLAVPRKPNMRPPSIVILAAVAEIRAVLEYAEEHGYQSSRKLELIRVLRWLTAITRKSR